MSEITLENALNHCIDQLASGSSVEDCLRLYPQFAVELRPMLEAGLLARRAQYNALEVSAAQNRVRSHVVGAMMGQQANTSSGAWLRLVATFVVIVVAVLGLVSASVDSLPGDPLYSVKRLTENAQLLLGDAAVLREQFAQRRIDEINTLLAQGREAEVEFEGDVEAINGELWRVAGLSVRVPSATPDIADVQVGDKVHVRANTTSTRELVASRVTLVEDRIAPLLPSLTPTATVTPTLTPTPTRTLVPDVDSDGLPDSADLCPTVPGAVINDGCPLPTATYPQVPTTDDDDDHEDDHDNSGRGSRDDDHDDREDNSGPGGGGDDDD